MSESLTVSYYDGKRNVPHQAEISLDGGKLRVVYNGGQTAEYPLHSIAYMAGVGGVLPALELPGDARIEFLNHDVPHWLPLQNKIMLKQVGRLEKSWKWAAVSLVAMICVVAVVFKWGIPAAAYHAAHHLPEKTLQGVGNQAEEIILELTGETKLSAKRRREISDLYYQKLKPENPAKLLFREGGELGANAFAIPNNTIMLTDALVDLAKHDHEILAVLAHEQGHLKERHSLQQALRGIGMGVFLLTLTGDATDIIDGLPVLFATAKYSQEFELEADLHAINELKRLNIPPQHLADFLQRLHQAHGHGDENSAEHILSTHPVTSERVKQVEQHAK
ncbi:M48 family metallopeptidase [Neisseria weaveri]|uniref:M48 family metallopeptidase n=1 Tax=Neisseria weaveri TaxID=28091 RepID=UPI000D2F5B6C|nr:M48 family metallopeptidase [Neisseria weaveri]